MCLCNGFGVIRLKMHVFDLSSCFLSYIKLVFFNIKKVIHVISFIERFLVVVCCLNTYCTVFGYNIKNDHNGKIVVVF